MKNKPTRHKGENTFKFLPFSERIANVDVDIFHRIGHQYEAYEEDAGCYFHQAIQKWNVLNLTEHFGQFKKEIKAHTIVTLPQLLHNKDEIIETLQRYLKEKNILSLQPLLDLVVALARDLHIDFYHHYEDFLNIIIDLLNSKEVEQLEWAFTCLAYLFKILWRVLTKNIQTIFNTLIPLLSDEKPEYINNFAAESFAFVARKVKHRKAFLLMIVKTIKENKDGIIGSGRLLFEVIHGVKASFHNCAKDWLVSYLDLLHEENLPRIWYDILEEIVKNIFADINYQHCEIFWNVFINSSEKLLLENTETSLNNLNFVLRCMGQGVEHKRGVFLYSMQQQFIQHILQVIITQEVGNEILLTCTKIIILLLLSNNLKLQQEQASSLIRAVLSLNDKSILMYFFENIFDCSLFEALILPPLVQFCVEFNLDNQTLHLLSKLILRKSPLCINGINLEKWTKYSIRFNTKETELKMRDVLHDYLSKPENNEDYVCAVICYPHACNGDGSILLENLKKFCDKIKNRVDVHENIFLFNTTFECLVHIGEENAINSLLNMFIEYILPICDNPNNLPALQSLDLFITALKKDNLTRELLSTLHKYLENNFNSPYHELRLYTAHIYSQFDKIFMLGPLEEWRIFEYCYKIESTDVLIQTYREQLLYVEKLDFCKPQMAMCKDTEYNTIPLRYFCGMLHINFKLLWEPVIDMISSHARGLETTIFWDIFAMELKKAAANVRDRPKINEKEINFSDPSLSGLYKNSFYIEDKIDYDNYRNLLWRSMKEFTEIAEGKTRDVSNLLLDFFENEFSSGSIDGWNFVLSKCENYESAVATKKSNVKTLLRHLEVFSKFRSPKSMYKEAELYKIYFDLLSHKNPLLQKAALDCIMTYKFKYLTPYSDHLYKLTDERNFKNELAIFRVDQDSAVVQKEHRMGLIPVVLKLVFGKMTAKTGLRTGGKSNGGQTRRNMILRFLSGCEENEMVDFIRLSFRFYNDYLNDDVKDICDNMPGRVNLQKFVPPKRLLSTLNMVNVILEQFGGLMEKKLLGYLLKLVFFIGSLLKGVQDQREKVHEGYFGILKNLRTTAVKIINKFFEIFESYPWNLDEINAIFDLFVWPNLKKIPVEGIQNLTAVSKLLICWGSNPRYFPLLVKHIKGNQEEYPLIYVMNLLRDEKTNFTVINSIMEVIEKLLTLKPNEEDENNKIPSDFQVAFKDDLLEKLKVDESLNFGSCILLPHVNIVLEVIKKKFEKKYKVINQRESFILSRISELVTDSDISDKLLELLLPVIRKNAARLNENALLQMITTVKHLIQNVDIPKKHIKMFSPLFDEVNHPTARKILIEILQTMSQDVEYKTVYELLRDMNAFDPKWIEQPDFQVRSEAFGRVFKMIEEKTISLELSILIIHNCFNFMRNEKDLSLRDKSSHCLKTICPYLIDTCKKQGELGYVLDETLFTAIRNGLKSKNDDYRNECISLLGCLARECPRSHVILRDLNKLTNSQDSEVDFFENITHLQIYRHAKALLKFSSVYREEETTPNIRTMTQFVLPMTTFYLCNEKFAGKNSLVDAAIENVGTICRLLPWQQYEGLLKYYLGLLQKKIDYQKQLVRLIVTILDAFHFDLSKANAEEIKTLNETIAKKMDIEEPEVVDEKTIVEEIINVDADTPELNETKKVNGNADETNDEQELDEVLEKIDIEQEMENTEESIKPYNRIAILCKSSAKRVTNGIQNVLLPQLYRNLAELTQYESSHKVNRKRTCSEREEEDLLRVPISLALVKLLQKLPKHILDANITGILAKLCTFLKSQLESVRRVTRESLQKIMITLGPEYLTILFNEMVPLLSKGFLAHVLVYTVHSVLSCMKEMFKPKDIDKVLTTVLKLCKADLFGVLAEEKEIPKIASKVSEAKSSKSLDTFHILAQFITGELLNNLVDPLKEILTTTRSYRTVQKIREIFKRITLGLIDNKFVDAEFLLNFSYENVSYSINEQIESENRKNLSEQEIDRIKRRKVDCFIIPKEPVYRSGRRTTNVKSSDKTNEYVVTEFGLKICYFLLKRDILKGGDNRKLLDRFVPNMKYCLESKNIKLSTVTLQCLPWLLKCDLPSLKEGIEGIAEIIFTILHKYAAAGLSKGDNFDLVVASFKAVTVLVRDVKYHTINQEQLTVLLLYIEQDLHNHERQATAFGLLKALLSRKLTSPEIYEIIRKVAEMSVASELPHVRDQSRNVVHQFVMDYPLGSKLSTYVNFYLSQLKFELQTGRESAIIMVDTLIKTFPLPTLKKFCGTFFVTLSARLINDDQPSCRKMIGESIQEMLKRLPKEDRDSLFVITTDWLKDEIVNHRRLACQLIGFIVMVEKSSFESRLTTLTPLIVSQFQQTGPASGNHRQSEKSREDDKTEDERLNDHRLFQLSQMLLKICSNCPGFLKRTNDVEVIAKYVQSYLAYPHEWVRLASAQFLGYVLTSIDPARLSKLINENGTDVGYLSSEPVQDLKSLTLDLCDQLQPKIVKNDLAEQVVKNLVFVARVLEKTDQNIEEINLLWLVKRIRKIVYKEIIEAITSITLRTEIFKWIAGVVTALDVNVIVTVVHHLLAPLVREMLTTDEKDAPLRQLAKEVGLLIKKKIGMERYQEALAKAEQFISVKRAERKRTRTQLAVTDPELHAKKKLRHNEKKKEAKKKKIIARRGVKKVYNK